MKFLALFVLLVVVVVALYTSYNTNKQTSPIGINNNVNVRQFALYGSLIDLSSNNDANIFKIQAESINYEPNKTYMEIKSKKIDNKTALISGNNYVFIFQSNDSIESSSVWDTATIGYISIDAYKDILTFWQEKRIKIDQLANILCSNTYNYTNITIGEACRISTEIIKIDMPKEFEVSLVNNNNYDLKFRVLDASIADKYVYFPFVNEFEENYMDLQPINIRYQNSILSTCTVDFDKNQHTASAKSNTTVTFSVLCSEPITRERTYKFCDIRGENCKEITTKTSFLLVGEIETEDSLGNALKIPREKVLKQFIEIS